jgi:hypothetical protein
MFFMAFMVKLCGLLSVPPPHNSLEGFPRE